MGRIDPSELPIHVVRRNGHTLSLNTRSTLALRRGGVDPSRWTIRDMTGDPLFEQILNDRLVRNRLFNEGTDVLRITGAGKHASSLK